MTLEQRFNLAHDADESYYQNTSYNPDDIIEKYILFNIRKRKQEERQLSEISKRKAFEKQIKEMVQKEMKAAFKDIHNILR